MKNLPAGGKGTEITKLPSHTNLPSVRVSLSTPPSPLPAYLHPLIRRLRSESPVGGYYLPMGTPETSREPCPDRILDDIGGAFSMGAVGGSAFHFIKGLYNSPRGERFSGGAEAVRMNAPRIGGSFAVWGALFSTFDCSMVYLRQKEDPWNSIIAGAATGGFLQMRQGISAASRAAIFGGVLLALIEGAGIMLNKVLSVPQNMPPMEEPFPAMMNPSASGIRIGNDQGSPKGEDSSSWFGGIFGAKKKKEEATKGSAKTEILESFDGPSPPIPKFEYK